MNAAVSSFDAIIKQRVSKFEIDLSNATLCEVLQSFESYQKTKNISFRLTPIITNIRTIERSYNTTFLPTDVTDLFYSCFIRFLFEKDLKPSTVHNYCSAIRSALQWATRHCCRVSSTFDRFSVDVNEPLRVALSADEISHIAHFDINTLNVRPQLKQSLTLVRDAFVVQTNLFQRYSDIVRISKENFSNGVFTCIQKKTGSKAMVDIKRYSITPELTFCLLEKYNYEFPYKGNVNNFNRHLHFLLSQLNGSFQDDIIMEFRRNGEIVKTIKKKWECIASHSARRSSITYASKHAKTESEIRRCSGHRSRSDSFQRYVCD